MRIAIPVWQNRVSPLFDTTAHLLVAEGAGQKISRQEITSVESLTLFQRTDLLRKLQIEIFICGGITKLKSLNNSGLEPYLKLILLNSMFLLMVRFGLRRV